MRLRQLVGIRKKAGFWDSFAAAANKSYQQTTGKSKPLFAVPKAPPVPSAPQTTPTPVASTPRATTPTSVPVAQDPRLQTGYGNVTVPPREGRGQLNRGLFVGGSTLSDGSVIDSAAPLPTPVHKYKSDNKFDSQTGYNFTGTPQEQWDAAKKEWNNLNSFYKGLDPSLQTGVNKEKYEARRDWLKNFAQQMKPQIQAMANNTNDAIPLVGPGQLAEERERRQAQQFLNNQFQNMQQQQQAFMQQKKPTFIPLVGPGQIAAEKAQAQKYLNNQFQNMQQQQQAVMQQQQKRRAQNMATPTPAPTPNQLAWDRYNRAKRFNTAQPSANTTAGM